MFKFVLTVHRRTDIVKKIRHRYLNHQNTKIQRNTIWEYIDNAVKFQINEATNSVSGQVREFCPDIQKKNAKLKLVYKHISLLTIKQEHSNSIEKCLDNILTEHLIDTLESYEIFHLLNTVIKIIPSTITETNFYKQSLLQLHKAAERTVLTTTEIILLIYFSSFQNKKGSTFMKNLLPYIPDIKTLSIVEKCVIAEAIYRCSIKFDKYQLKIFENIIEENPKILLNDSRLLVPLCKIIRISGPSNNLTLKNLSAAIIESNRLFNFMITVHILSLYAEALIFESSVINKLVTHCIEIINHDRCSYLRLKDIERFFWIISTLGLTLTTDNKDVLKMYVEQRLKEYTTDEHLGRLVNTILCLHMLQCFNETLIKKCFTEHILEPIFYENYHWKVRARLQLLLRQINIEMKMDIPNSLRTNFRVNYTPTDNIILLNKIGLKLVTQTIAKHAEIECPVQILTIPGLTIISREPLYSKYHVDILDDLTCFKNTVIPHGIMKLKMRLLACLGYKQILIKKDVFKEEPCKTEYMIEQQIINNIRKNL